MKPPWTDDEVASLNAFQDSGVHAHFTCAGCDDVALLATTAGWQCLRCGRVSDFAWRWAADWSWQSCGVPTLHDGEEPLKTRGG